MREQVVVVVEKGCVRGKSSGRRQDEGYGQVGNDAIPPRPAGTAHNGRNFVHRHRTRAGTLADSNSRVINAKTKT